MYESVFWAIRTMSEWTTVWDHEFAGFGRRSITFRFTKGTYVVDVDDGDQDQVFVSYGNRKVPWVVFNKEVNKAEFRLSGMTWGNGDPHDEGLGYLFELTLSTSSVMRYYGDRVLVHEDHEAPPSFHDQ
jgi:hypothetical protein